MNDVTAVAQVILQERRARDRGWWDLMRECLAPDAALRLSWFRGRGAAFIAASQEMAARGDAAGRCSRRAACRRAQSAAACLV
ncbi:hypothetical protein ACWCXH_07190 [Kitasatospora sp. NPDC001660]